VAEPVVLWHNLEVMREHTPLPYRNVCLLYLRDGLCVLHTSKAAGSGKVASGVLSQIFALSGCERRDYWGGTCRHLPLWMGYLH